MTTQLNDQPLTKKNFDTTINKFQKTLVIQAAIYNYRQYNSIYIYGDMFLEKIQQSPSLGDP